MNRMASITTLPYLVTCVTFCMVWHQDAEALPPTGSDFCEQADVRDVPVGPIGQPESIQFSGDNQDQTRQVCEIGPTWWESFRIVQAADVSISLCGTTPTRRMSERLNTSCESDPFLCPDRLLADELSFCADGNPIWTYRNLPIGTYHRPLDQNFFLSGPAFGRGPYEMQIAAELPGGIRGACCSQATDTCDENTLQENCVASTQLFSEGLSCCEASCFPDPDPAPGTGANCCVGTTPTDLVVGPPNLPNTITMTGNATGATNVGLPCSPTRFADWWVSFRIDRLADVTISSCPFGGFLLAPPVIHSSCDGDGSPCGIAATLFGPTCGAVGFGTKVFKNLPAGTYYVPIETYPTYSSNFALEVSASEPAEPRGACCEASTGTCIEFTVQSACSGPDQEWADGATCCLVECRAPSEPEFDASGVTLLSLVSIASFPAPGVPGGLNSANDVWGYVSSSGREYALIGFGTATGFVEVTDARNPVVLGVVEGFSQDLKVFGNHAYIVGEDGVLGLQIVDLSDIDNGNIPLVKTTDLGMGLHRSHNIFIDEVSGFLYLARPNLNQGNGIMAFDLNADPVNPTFVGAWTDSEPNVRCHDLYVETYTEGDNAGKEIAFCFAEGSGLRIVDVTDKGAMTRLSFIIYPNTSFAHQGWLTPDRQHLFLGDESDESGDPDVIETVTHVIDVTDLSNPFLETSFSNGLCGIDHNLMIGDGLVYEANYSVGLRIFDIADTQNIHEVAHFDTHPEHNDVNLDGAWGVFAPLPSGTILVSDIERGLFVFGVDCDGNGVEDWQDIADATQPDCDLNGYPDECDLVAGRSPDCNENEIPDVCDIADGTLTDCNLNGLADTCELADGLSPDCNGNDVPDECDIASGGSPDGNGNGVPDECDASAPRLADPPHGIRKNRFVSISPTSASPASWSVELLDLACSLTGATCAFDSDCTVCVGGPNGGAICSRNSECPSGSCDPSGESCQQQNPPVMLGWVGDPVPMPAEVAQPGVTAALVVSDRPAARAWNESIVHVGDCEIAPVRSYAIRATADGIFFSDPLIVATIAQPQGKFWGDLVGNFNGIEWSEPNTLVNVDDVTALIAFITDRPGAAHITRIDLAGGAPSFINFLVNATDLLLELKAFQGDPFPPIPLVVDGYPADGDVTQCP